jgi:hypothetical protein
MDEEAEKVQGHVGNSGGPTIIQCTKPLLILSEGLSRMLIINFPKNRV